MPLDQLQMRRFKLIGPLALGAAECPENLKALQDNPPAGDGEPLIDACVMQAVSFIAGEPWTDVPKCVWKPLTNAGISINDTASNEDRELLRPLIERMIGTATLCLESKRAGEKAAYDEKVAIYEERRLIGKPGTGEIMTGTCAFTTAQKVRVLSAALKGMGR